MQHVAVATQNDCRICATCAFSEPTRKRAGRVIQAANQRSRRQRVTEDAGRSAAVWPTHADFPAENTRQHDLTCVELGADAAGDGQRAEQITHLVSLGDVVDGMYECVELTAV